MRVVREASLRKRLLAVGAFVVCLAVAGIVVASPFSGSTPARASSIDNGSPTSTRRVERSTLTSQAQVSATLGYAGSRTVSVPSGTPPSALLQAQQAVTSARSQLTAAQVAVAGDRSAVAAAKRTLTSDRAAKRTACAGSAATSPTCAAAKQTVAQDEANRAQAAQKLAADQPQLASAEEGLSGAEQALAPVEASATSYDSSSASYTKLPAPGEIVRRGGVLYAINGQPTLLLYGSAPAWRAFRAGMSPGPDVAELNANLSALGYGAPSGDIFTFATAAAIDALQRAHDLGETGELLLGSIAFEPGALRVKAVTPTLGQAVQPGQLLTASSTRHDVAVELDASQQAEVKVGDRVTVTLPNNSTTPGVVTSVGKVATTPSSDQSQGGGSSSPTIEVDIRLLHIGAAGHLDQAPVNVSITTASVKHTLVVPVDALVALAGGGFAVEEVESSGLRRLVAVTPGLFDDSAGQVQVSGSGLAVGQRVVVPAS
jgi:hypothetical protein